MVVGRRGARVEGEREKMLRFFLSSDPVDVFVKLVWLVAVRLLEFLRALERRDLKSCIFEDIGDADG